MGDEVPGLRRVVVMAVKAPGGQGSRDASNSRVAASAPGSARPRFAARRRIPDAALGLKKYLDRSRRVSKTSGKEDTTAALGDSEELSVQHSVGEPIPALAQCPEDGTHCAAVEFHAPAGTGTSCGGVGDVGDEDAVPVELVPSSAPNSASVSHAGFVTGAGADG